MPERILVTGGAGFIASHVVRRLLRRWPDYKVVVLDKLDYCASLESLREARTSANFRLVRGDIQVPPVATASRPVHHH